MFGKAPRWSPMGTGARRYDSIGARINDPRPHRTQDEIRRSLGIESVVAAAQAEVLTPATLSGSIATAEAVSPVDFLQGPASTQLAS